MTDPVPFKVGLDEARKRLETSAHEFVTLFEHGTLSVELYQPDQVDRQIPHERDEVYIIATGSGKFEVEGEVTPVNAGDFLFVPANAAHRFSDFTNDFSTWVLFYGPKEGEQGVLKNRTF